MNQIKNIISGTSGVRTISFNQNSNDPYVIFHETENELSDERLDELHREWRGTNGAPEENEEFEVFLQWLEAEKGFVYLPVVGAMKNFE